MKKWSVSDLNFIDEIRSRMDLPKTKDIVISDCTLRDGEQQAGVAWTPQEKVGIVKKLDELGIHEISVGNVAPWVSETGKQALKAVLKEKVNAKLAVLCSPATKEMVDEVVKLGYSRVRLGGRIDDENLLRHRIEVLQYAKDRGLFVIFTQLEATRMPLDWVKHIFETVIKSRAVNQVRVNDTVGAVLPETMTYFIKELKKVTGNTPLEVHCHDDFGLGTANTLAALNGGANVLSTSMNGVGERCGNAATEEVLMALLVFYNIDFGMKYEKLYELSKTVQELTGISPAPYKAIVGENLFKIEFLETITEAEKSPLGSCVGAYIPSLVGQRRQLVLGRNSTEETVRYKLKELGIKVEERDIPAILKRVLETAEEKRTWIRDNEFKTMIAQMRAGR